MFKNRQGQIRSGWIIAALMASLLIITTILMLLCMIILMIVLMQSAYSFIDIFSAILTDWLWLLITIQCIVMIVISIFAWKRILKRPLPDMGLTRLKGHGKELIFGLVFGAVSISLVIVTGMLFGIIKFSDISLSFSPTLILYLLVFVLVGFAEELFCRGLVMSVLRRTQSKAMILIVSSILFSLLHITNPGYTLLPLINIALIGALFGYMFIRSGHIWMPVGYHIMWNYVQGSVFGFNVSGIDFESMMTAEHLNQDQLLSNVDFGLEGGIITTVFVLLGFLAVAWFYRGKRFNFFAVDEKDAPQIDNFQSQMQVEN